MCGAYGKETTIQTGQYMPYVSDHCLVGKHAGIRSLSSFASPDYKSSQRTNCRRNSVCTQLKTPKANA
ncbi:hypothetical protein TNCV_407891 [Trichonephila clavipes]|nr:hypothetical protein TNCV_407891 [Trichonephila clavipes]